jgi:hypothetical protein
VLRRADGWTDVVPGEHCHEGAADPSLAHEDIRAEEDAMSFGGVDWGDAHHDLCLLGQDGTVLGARRIAVGWPG